MKRTLTSQIISIIKIPIILFLAFYFSLVLVYCIPSKLMTQNVKESYKILKNEGEYPNSYADKQSYDNFTVALMLNNALKTNRNPFSAAIKAERCDGNNQIDALHNAILGKKSEIEYSRYWHGYLVFLKPLLVFLNIYQIRLLSQAAILFLLMLVGICLAETLGRFGIFASFALAGSFGIYSVVNAAMTLPLFPSFALSLLGSIYILKFCKLKTSKVASCFFVFGALTVFFDFLDNPILTLGMPLCFLILKSFYSKSESKDENLFRSPLFVEFVSCVFWGLGYGILWAGKWILAFFVYGIDAFKNAFRAIAFRIGKSAEAVNYPSSPYSAIVTNLKTAGSFRIKLILLIALAVVITGIILFIILKIKNQKIQKILETCLALGIVSLLPFVWYAVLNNHSVIHAGIISFRNLLLTMFSGLVLAEFMIACILKEKRNG